MSERHIHMAGHVVERHIIRGSESNDRDVFEYVLLRVVPRVERGECINAGVLVYCRPQGYVGARTHLDEARLLALDPDADVAGIRAALGRSSGSAAAVRRRGRRPVTTPGGAFAGSSRPARRSCSRAPCTPGSPPIRRPRPNGCWSCW